MTEGLAIQDIVDRLQTQDYQVIQLSNTSSVEEIAAFRKRIWQLEGLNSSTLENFKWSDQIDVQSFIWKIEHKNTLIATARLSIHNRVEDIPYADSIEDYWSLIKPYSPYASLNRLVVHNEFRGRKIARALDEIRIATARDQGASSVVALTSKRRSSALQELGFETLGQAKHIEGSERLLNPSWASVKILNRIS